MTEDTVYPCIECGGTPTQVGGEWVYPHRADLHHKRFWLCKCGAYCGSHIATGAPLGSPAGPETRKARNAAHAAFDPLWLKPGDKKWLRTQAYRWLADMMNRRVEDCHIGMMTAQEAWEVVELCKQRMVGR
jgi:hypothetical protein